MGPDEVEPQSGLVSIDASAFPAIDFEIFFKGDHFFPSVQKARKRPGVPKLKVLRSFIPSAEASHLHHDGRTHGPDKFSIVCAIGDLKAEVDVIAHIGVAGEPNVMFSRKSTQNLSDFKSMSSEGPLAFGFRRPQDKMIT